MAAAASKSDMPGGWVFLPVDGMPPRGHNSRMRKESVMPGMKGCAAVAAAGAVGVGLVAGACRTLGPTAEPVVYGGQPCWRLANDTVDLVVNPGIGRIVRYGFAGDANVLWEDLRAAERAPNPRDWKNWGGDKIWPWPQGAWKEAMGRTWPPPGDGDIAAYEVATVPGGLRMTSPELPGLGLRVTREIVLAATGTRVTIRSRLEPAGAATSGRAWAAWAVTQVPIPDVILARLDVTARQATHAFPEQIPFLEPKRVGNTVILTPDPEKHCKVGLEADRLAGVRGDVLFVQTLVRAGTSAGDWVPGEKAQVFASGGRNPPAGQMPPYLEMELTSPSSRVAEAPPGLAVEWQLRRLSDAEREPAALCRIVESL